MNFRQLEVEQEMRQPRLIAAINPFAQQEKYPYVFDALSSTDVTGFVVNGLQVAQWFFTSYFFSYLFICLPICRLDEQFLNFILQLISFGYF